MKKIGIVHFKNERAGIVWQDEDGYGFVYDSRYLQDSFSQPVSLTLPLREKPFLSNAMLPFFDGLIPEGWVLDIAVDNWKLNERDRMELLLVACKDCIGAISIIKAGENE
jgi:serine/threonine-protein kinase HipA